MSHRFLTGLLSALLAAPLLAQGGGFTGADLVLYGPKIPGASASNSGLVRMDLAAGTAEVLVGATQVISSPGAACFDLHRQRVLFIAKLGPVAQPTHLWAVNAAGELDDLGFPGLGFNCMAPTGDGRVYLRHPQSQAPFKYLDAANQLQTLMDDTGTVPFLLDGSPFVDVGAMTYEPTTSALFVASASHVCSGGSSGRVNVRKLPLSADGQRVIGPITCAQFDVGPGGDAPVGWSRGPAGQLMLIVTTGLSGVAPKILCVDPATLTFSVFASSGGFSGDPLVPAGTYAPSIERAVILDGGGNHLRAYAAGDSGVGTNISFTGAAISGLGGGGFTLVAVESTPCTGGWMPYGAGLAGTGGKVPALTGVGFPMVDGIFGLSIANGVGGGVAQMFVGLTPAAVPFKGGTFLVGNAVLQATVALGGAAGVAGAGSLSLPAALPDDALLEGLWLYLQVGIADAGAVKGAALTNGLRMEIGG
jgi:hypothetical protein